MEAGMVTGANSRTTVGPILAIVGGTVLAIGSLTQWVSIGGRGPDFSASGIDVGDGWIAVVIGVALAAVGIASLRNHAKVLAQVCIVIGLAGIVLGGWEIVAVEELAVDALEDLLPPDPGISAEENRDIIAVAIQQAGANISAGIGLFLTIGGGALGVIGGASLRRRTHSTAPASSSPTDAPADTDERTHAQDSAVAPYTLPTTDEAEGI
jgi:hypothetical protein